MALRGMGVVPRTEDRILERSLEPERHLGFENQRKSNLRPSQYVPLNESQTCAYLVQYAEVKVAWRLSITTADYEATAAGLENCLAVPTWDNVRHQRRPAQGFRRPRQRRWLATGGHGVDIRVITGICHPAYEPCIPNLEEMRSIVAISVLTRSLCG